MPLNSASTGRFLSRVLLPIAMFILLLSLAGNAFLLYSGTNTKPIVTTSASSSVSTAEMVLGPVAFGTVSRPVSIKPQTIDGSGSALPAVKEYVLDQKILPELGETMPVYRDQGTPLDVSYFAPFFIRLGAPLDPEKLQLLPETFTFRSADGSLHVTFTSAARTLSIAQVKSPQSVAPTIPADDIEVEALAERFAQVLAIPLPADLRPRVHEEKIPGQTPRTLVSWPLLFNGHPVLTSDGVPVPALTIQVSRVSHRAISATVSLLSPSVLVSSPYPLLKNNAITQYLLSGGLLPSPKSTKGKTGTFSAASAVYLLLPADVQYPLYLVPGVRASYSTDEKCPTCAPKHTIVPTLDPSGFDWRMKDVPVSAPLKP